MKILRLLLLSALLARPALLSAAENRYEVLGRLLTPFASLLAKKSASPNRALLLTARLESWTDLPPALLGTRVELALEHPDKLRLRGPVLGEELTICRNGQDLWAHPGARAEALLRVARAGITVPPPDPDFRLAPFALPIPEKQLVFLPALFQVKDVGPEPLDGEPCRVLDLFLLPELVKSLRAPGWAARVWVRGDSTPARLSVAKPGWQIVVRFERVAFSPTLPASTWQPLPEQAADVLKLDSARYQQLLRAVAQ